MQADLRDRERSAPSDREELLVELEGRLSASGIRARKRARRRSSRSFQFARRSARILHRTGDIIVSYLALCIFSPVILFAMAVAEFNKGGVRTYQRLGLWGGRFGLYQIYFPPGTFLSGSRFLTRLPALVNVLKGDMSMVGPRPIAPQERFSESESRQAWKRYSLRPGLLSLWWLRKRANIAFDSEVSLDLEYVHSQSLLGDLGIAARSIPASLFSGEPGEVPAQIRFCGIRIDNLTMAEASVQIVELARSGVPQQVCFVNADCVNIACRRVSYLGVLKRSTMVLADGIGVRLAGKLLRQNVRENVNGTDMLPYLCSAIEEAGESLYLLGGKPGVAEDVAKWMHERYPTLKVVGTADGYFTAEQEPAVLEAIRAAKPAVLLVAMGAPRQEEWISTHLLDLGQGVAIGVGGLFDFYSGRISRAPSWIRELGMEWFYRFVQEPRRMFRRYFLGNFEFLTRVLAERLRGRKPVPAEASPR